MASTFSTNLKIELQTTGENSGTWGTITNTNLGTALEQAIVGYGNPSYASDANLTLTYTDTNAAQAARALVLNVTSAVSLTATRELIVPTIQKQYIVQNNTTGSQSITVKTSAGTGITVSTGRKAHLYVDGTNVIFMDDFVDINGGSIDGTTIGANSAAAGNFTTVDTTNIEVTNLKAKDGTTAGSIADATGVVTLGSSVLTTTDINGGTIDGTTIGGSSAAAGSFTTLTTSSTVTLNGGTANGVLYLNGSKVATSGSALQFSGTKLSLSAAGGADFVGVFTNTTAATPYILRIQEPATPTSGYPLLDVVNNAGSTAYFRVDSGTGNVGIGTASPASKLDTAGTIRATSQTVPSSGTGAELFYDATNAGLRGYNRTGSAYVNLALNDNVYIGGGSSGNVGIGTASPTSGFRLDVVGGDFRVSDVASDDGVEIGWSAGGNAGFVQAYDRNASAFRNLIFNNAATLDTSGNLGLGTTSPGSVGVSGYTRLVLGAGSGATDGLTIVPSGTGGVQFTDAANVKKGYLQWDSSTGALALGTAGTTKATLDSSGNLGLGVTPSAWSIRALQVGSGFAAWSSGGTNARIFANTYYDGAYKYVGNGRATQYEQDGYHAWYLAANNTSGAGAAIPTFTQAMTLDASGNLAVGTTTVDEILRLNGSSNATARIRLQNQGTTLGWFGSYLGITALGNANDLFVANATNNALIFGTNGTERARITSGGDLFVGGTTGSSRLNLQTATNSSTDSNYITLYNAGENVGHINWINGNGDLARITGTKAGTGASANDGILTFSTATDAVLTERGRFTSGGYFKASNDGTYVESTQCHELRTTEDARAVIVTATNASYTSDAVQIRASRNTTNNSFYALTYYNVGATAYKFQVADSGNVTNTNGSYGTISDVKMKTDIVDAGSQWADMKAVRFRKFKMKNDPSGLMQLGVVAQELEQTSPGLVDEHADRDAEGNDLGTTTKSVKTSVLLMKAAVALQEAMARIEQLEADMAALKASA